MTSIGFAAVVVLGAFVYDQVELLTYGILLLKISCKGLFVCFLLRSGLVDVHFELLSWLLISGAGDIGLETVVIP